MNNTNQRLRIACVLLLCALPQAVFATHGSDGICGRTYAVHEEIVSTLQSAGTLSSTEDCADVTADDLARLTSLKWGNHRNGLLRVLRPGDFAGLSAVTYLDLRHNHIRELTPGVFDGLSELSQLNLEYNNLSELKPGVFAGLSNLGPWSLALRLHGNQLWKLPPGAFTGLPRSLQYTFGVPSAPQVTPILPADVSGKLTVAWSASVPGNNSTINRYRLRWKLPTATTYSAVNISTARSTASAYTLNGLTAGTTYDVQVAAITRRGQTIGNFWYYYDPYRVLDVGGDWATAKQATPAQQATPPPTPPRNLSVAEGYRSLNLTWDAPTTHDGFTASELRYEVRWRASEYGDFAATDHANGVTAVIGATEYQVQSLREDVPYTVQVRVRGFRAGEWATSNGTPTKAFSVDVDSSNNTAMHANDVVLIARNLFGVTDRALTEGQTSAHANDVAKIIAVGNGVLDVDASGVVDWKDGVMIARYALGIRGDALVADLRTRPPGTLTEISAARVEANIAALPR